MTNHEPTTGRHFLCRIGLHRYRPWACNSLINPLPIERCERPGCGVGRQFHLSGAILTYTAEEMRMAAEVLAEKEAAEEARP